MADFLTVYGGGRTAFLPFTLRDQSKDLCKPSTCICGSVCSRGRDWMSSCVSGIWRHRTYTTPSRFGVLSNLSLAGQGIYLWVFFYSFVLWVFFSLISKLCYLHHSAEFFYFKFRELRNEADHDFLIKSIANPTNNYMWCVCVNALSYKTHIKTS